MTNLLKLELLDGQVFESRTLARREIFENIELALNCQRRHPSLSSLDDLILLKFERQAGTA